MEDVAAQVAAAFAAEARALLREAGRPVSQNALARMLGEHPENFSRAIRGSRVSLERVHGWAVRLAALGFPPLQIVITATEGRVERCDSSVRS